MAKIPLKKLPTLVNTKDLKNIGKLMEKLRATGEEAYLVTNSEIQAVITPIPVFDDSEEAQAEREKSLEEMDREIEKLYAENPDIEMDTEPTSKEELRKYYA